MNLFLADDLLAVFPRLFRSDDAADLRGLMGTGGDQEPRNAGILSRCGQAIVEQLLVDSSGGDLRLIGVIAGRDFDDISGLEQGGNGFSGLPANRGACFGPEEMSSATITWG